MKKIFAVISLLLSFNAWAESPVRTTNPVGYGRKESLKYGQEQSDWGQAKLRGCIQSSTIEGLKIFCSGKTRIMGPGGGGDFVVDYLCQFLMTQESAHTYVVVKAECE